MVLKDGTVVVADCFRVTHCQEEGIVNTGVGDVAGHAGEEPSHYVQIAEVYHKASDLDEKVEVTRDFDYARYIVVTVLCIGCFLDGVK